jgi:acylphosphatase
MPRMDDELTRRRVVVHGRVQGVFFRDGVRRRAEAVGVAGWVRNRPDGTVEAVFEGPAEAVEAMVAFCRRGPARAVVERVDLEEEAPRGERGFEVS